MEELNIEFLRRTMVLFVDTDGILTIWGQKNNKRTASRLKGHENQMKNFLIAHARITR